MLKTPKQYLRYLLIIPFVTLLIWGIYATQEQNRDIVGPWVGLVNSFICTAGLWFGCSMCVKWLWKKYPWERNPIKHLVFELACILGYTNIFILVMYLVERYSGFFHMRQEDLFSDIFITNLITLLISAIHEAVYFYAQWKTHFSKSVKLEKDTIEARYEMLKAQINPHFLFNSLNSLMVMVDDNAEAEKHLHSLSDFLRYSLASRDAELVTLDQELEMLNKYVAIQKARFQNRMIVMQDISPEMLKKGVPPMVLQMLVENCLKHNVVSREKPIDIRVITKNERIMVQNTLQLITSKDTQSNASGQGLRNIVERYRYFTTDEVTIKNDGTFFTVELPLLEMDF